MIHFTLQDGPEVIVLSQHDIDRLRGGHHIINGGRTVLIVFTPDQTRAMVKINDELLRGAVSAERFDATMREIYKETADARQNRQPDTKGPASDVGAPADHGGSAGG